MDLSQVKLIVSDMDGTLLNSKGEVSPHFYNLYKKLKENNVHFIAASGRQYYSIIHKLDHIKDEITVIAENGGFAIKSGKEIFSCCLPKEEVHKLIKSLRKLDDAHIVLCGKKQAYVEDKHDKFLELFDEYYYRYKLVDDLLEVEEDEFLKIACYSFLGSEKNTYPHFKDLEKQLKVKVSGEHWLDLSHFNANKGATLKYVQEKMGITAAETLVLGDYNNDIEMMEQAYFSYAMHNAHPNVKEIARFSTASNEDYGVELVLEQVLEAKGVSIPKRSKN